MEDGNNVGNNDGAKDGFVEGSLLGDKDGNELGLPDIDGSDDGIIDG